MPSPATVIIRPTQPSDIPQIQRIYAHHVLHGTASFEEEPPDGAELERRWRAVVDAALPYLSAVDEASGAIRGYAYAGRYRPRSAYRFSVEDSVYVTPEAAGRGIGRALLNEVVARAAACGMRQMLAIIGDSANVASIGLHKACGFVLVGTFAAVGFKHGRWLDSVLMQRSLGAGGTTLPSE